MYPTLQALDLSNNYISGQVPSELGLLTQLTSLLLQETRISGLLPREIELLTNIRQIWLSSSYTSGEGFSQQMCAAP